MQKTRLGITVGALGAITYFSGLFSGYLVAVVLAGYILLFESNVWLRRSAVKAIILMVSFSVATAVLQMIPDAFGILSDVAKIFGGHFDYDKVYLLVSAAKDVVNIVEKLLFIGLGLKALKQGTIVIPSVDEKVTKFMSDEQ